MKKDDIYIKHILECIEDVMEYSAAGKDGFINSRMAQDAILRKLQIMAESTQRLSKKTKQAIPEIEWKKIAGFRNVIVHEYLGTLILDVVWDAIQRELPRLEQAVTNYCKKAGIA